MKNNTKNEDNLRMVTDSAFHWASSIVMLHSKSNIGSQSPIILWNRTFNLQRSNILNNNKAHTESNTNNNSVEIVDCYFDFSQGYEKALFKLGIQAKNASCMAKVAVGGCKGVHGCLT